MLKFHYDSEADIPPEYKALYEEDGGKFKLSGVEGLRHKDDVAKVLETLDKERKAHAASKARVRELLGDMDPEDARAVLADARKSSPRTQDSNTSLDERLIPLQKERDKLMRQVKEAQERIEQFETANRQRTIRDAVADAARRSRVVETAVEDATFLAERIFSVAEDGVILSKDGQRVDEWLGDMKSKRPHWWATSAGGGAAGSGSYQAKQTNNPWAAGSWDFTAQALLVKQDPAKAQALAAQAGTTIGGPKPTA